MSVSERQKVRQRREHNRSRKGCVICKQRHIRCDEGRPSCGNCLLGYRPCRYEQVEMVPLRDRRSQRVSLPGVLEPWLMDSVAKSLPHHEALLSPIDCLPIKLPFKSRQLLKHYFEVYRQQDNDPPGSLNLMAIANNDPANLQTMFIIAACHFSFHAGSLQYFTATYHHQMGECFRLANERWLSQRRPHPRFMVFVAALCLAEAYTGNITAAEAHLRGLFELVDAQDAKGTRDKPAMEDDEADAQDFASLERCVRSTHNFSSAVVANIPDARLNISRQFKFPTRVSARLAESFSLVTFLPYFSSWTGHRIINSAVTINALREMTKFMAPRLPLSYHPIFEGVEVRMYMEMTKRIPLPTDGTADLLDVDRGANYVPMRSAFVIACNFYFCTLIGEWSVEKMRHSSCWHHLFKQLKRDVDQTRGALQMEGLKRDFWLWKVLVAATGLATMEAQSRRRTYDGDAGGAGDDDDDDDDNDYSVLALKAWFFTCLRTWSRATGVTDWPTVSQTLFKVVWLDKFYYGVAPERVFLEAMSDGVTS